MAVDRITGAGFKAEVSGSGDLNIAALTVDTADLSIHRTGDVRAGGAVKMLHVAVAGTGSVDAAGLRVARADVSVAGTGDVRAAVDGPARVAISGTGDGRSRRERALHRQQSRHRFGPLRRLTCPEARRMRVSGR